MTNIIDFPQPQDEDPQLVCPDCGGELFRFWLSGLLECEACFALCLVEMNEGEE